MVVAVQAGQQRHQEKVTFGVNLPRMPRAVEKKPERGEAVLGRCSLMRAKRGKGHLCTEL